MQPIPNQHQLDKPCKRFSGYHRKEDGRPIVWTGTTQRYAYIVEWEKDNKRPLRSGHILHHMCEHKWCIESSHLEEMTQAQHMKEHGKFAVLNKQRAEEKTHCPNGHEYNEENTRWVNSSRDGRYRVCKICAKESKENYRARQRMLGLPY